MITKRKLFSKEFCLFIFLILFATFVFNIVMILMPQPKVLSWQDFACYNFEQITEINEDGESVTYNLISTPQQLAGALKKSNYLSATSHGDYFTSTNNYKLTKDINLSGYSWTPANNDTVIDGNYHTIYNLTISQSATQVGFISSNSGTIKNLSFVNISVKNNYSYNSSTHTGGVVGYNTGTINNVSILTGTVAGNSFNSNYDSSCDRFVGGISGVNIGTITNCLNKAEISTGSQLGGIVGRNSEGSVNFCYNYGSISCQETSSPYLGGIAGYAYSGTISQCVNWGNVTNYFQVYYHLSSTVINAFSGGIVGYSHVSLSECGNYGNITATCAISYGTSYYPDNSYAGGIVGYSKQSVNYCYNRGNITAEAKTNTYDNTYGTAHNETQVHHLQHKKDGTVSNWGTYHDYAYYSCSQTTSSSSWNYSYAGGICGQASSVSYCYSSGNISGGYRSESVSMSFVLKEEFNKTDTSYYRNYNFKFYYTCNYENGISGYPISSISQCYYSGSVASDDVTGRYDVQSTAKDPATYINQNYSYRLPNVDEALYKENDKYWASDLNLDIQVSYKSGQYKLNVVLDGCNKSSSVSKNPITFNFPNVSKGTQNNNMTSSTFYKNLDTNYFAYNSSFNNGYPYLKNLHWGQ